METLGGIYEQIISEVFINKNTNMQITITPEALEIARKKKQESEALLKSMSNDDPSEPENICVGCE